MTVQQVLSAVSQVSITSGSTTRCADGEALRGMSSRKER
jgi:hypothetical protein